MASPVQVLSRKDLLNIGMTTIDDVVNTLTVNTGAQIYANNLEQGRNAGSTNVNLRGLGEASTLVLLNGTRNTWTPAVNLQGDQYVNLSTLVPMVAVGRMEVLKDGASAIYGSDAVAGVVNFITRDTFEGFEFNVEALDYTEGSSKQYDFSAIIGGAHEHGNLMAAFSYMQVGATDNAERWDDYKPTQNSITGFGYPSNIFNGPVRYVDPSCESGTQDLPPGLVFEAFLCRLRFGYYGSVISEEQRIQGYASGNYEISKNFDVFGEMVFANNEVIIGSVPTQPVIDPVYVPENHPDLIDIFAAGIDDPYAGVSRINEDGFREVQWFGRVLGAGTPQNYDLKPYNSWRAKGGLRGELSETWDYTMSYAYSIDETSANRRCRRTSDWW
jgi:iron complex outermembrane receptor protein